MRSSRSFKALTAALAAVAIGWCVSALPADQDEALEKQSERADRLGDHNGERASGRIAGDFTVFAGSSGNASALVTGLRDGSSITLTENSAKTTFTPATHRMGWGNVTISLALAQAELKAAGITSPTPAQIEAALNGGSVTTASGKTVTFSGILVQRSSGMGWGKIAKADGLKLGPIVSRVRADNDRLDKVARSDIDGHGRPDHAERPDHPEHPDRPDRPERPGKS